MCFRWQSVPICLLMLLACIPAAAQSACNANPVLEKVKIELASHQYEQAARSLGEIRDCAELSNTALFEIGWLYGRARHFDDSLKVFARIPENVPDRATHSYAVALDRFELGDYNGASSVLASLHSAKLADTKSENLLAVSYSKLGLYKEAYAVLAEEVQRNPSDLDTRLNLITVCAEGGDFKSAASAAAQATKLFPDSADAFVAYGAAQALLGHLAEAYEEFSNGAKLDPNRPDIQFFLALMDYQTNKADQAAQLLQTALRRGLQDSDLHYLLAECLLKLDAANTGSALQQLNEAITLNPDSVSARTLRGKLLLESGHADKAISDLELANQQDPEYRSAAYNLARAYRVAGRSADAQRMFAKVQNQSSVTVSETGNRRLNEALVPKEAGPQ